MTDPPNITAAAVPQTDNSQQQVPMQWQHTTALPDVATSPALEAAQLNDQEMTKAQTSTQQAHAVNETPPPNQSNLLPALTTALQAQHHYTMELTFC
jgi:phage gp29-like protein